MKNCRESVRFEIAEYEVLPEMVKIVRKQVRLWQYLMYFVRLM